MRELNSVQEKILDKTLLLISKNGSSSVSIRAIAKEAEVNVSAINYYFRSKDELLREVKEFYMKNTLAAYATLDRLDLEDEERLLLTCNEIMEYTLRYPGIMVILKEAQEHKEEDTLSNEIIKITEEMNHKLELCLLKVIGKDKHTNNRKSTIFFSSLLYPVVNHSFFIFPHLNLADKAERLKYISSIIYLLKIPMEE